MKTFGSRHTGALKWGFNISLSSWDHIYLLLTPVVHFVLIYPHFFLPELSFGNQPLLAESQKAGCTKISMCQDYFYCDISLFHNPFAYQLFPPSFLLNNYKSQPAYKAMVKRMFPHVFPQHTPDCSGDK